MSVVISGTGIYTPQQSIDNKELVESYNKYADSFNEMYKEDISNGTVEALTHSNDCLLYTSPSPRDQRGSRMPSSA